MKGFLPKKRRQNHSQSNSNSCSRIEEICNNLPKLLLTGKVQSTINKLSKKDLSIKKLFVNQMERDLKTSYVTTEFYCSCIHLGRYNASWKIA